MDGPDTEAEVFKVQVPLEDINAGHFRLVYAHLDAFLSAPTGQSLLRSRVQYTNRMCVAQQSMKREWLVFTYKPDKSEMSYFCFKTKSPSKIA